VHFIIIIIPHRSTVYVDAAYCYRRSSLVCLSVCLSRSWAVQTELSEMLFGLWTRVGPWNHVLDHRWDAEWAVLRAAGPAHANKSDGQYTQGDSAGGRIGTVRTPIWVCLLECTLAAPANAIEPPVCGGDAALCQITLTTCYYECDVFS